ncbi:MAG: acyl-CoA dehydrogenase family protein [Desulfobacterales bacterium]|nr:acyl-CoA dehydrogenase family protein [Desulfobacterales bacterium]MDX2512344.1 acyl-CoA dehydrogenase family protein [Desulfobacterales bacterium]
MLNFNLSKKQLDIQKKTREFALKEILPVAWYYDEKDEIPLTVLRKAYDQGLMNNDIPKKYGGNGYGILEGAIMTEEIAAACPGLATSLFDNSLGAEPLILCANEALKKRYLSKLLKEFKLICFATSEPGMGSDVAGLRCEAKKDGNDYRLNGTKYWITNGGVADYFSVFATEDPKSGHEGICAFIVEKSWEGVTIGKAIPKLGQRCSNTVGLKLKNVSVPKENMLAPPGEGFILAMKTFARTRPVVGAFGVGGARSAMEFAIDYAKKRRAFGSKIGDFQAVQFKIAEMYQKVETARLLVWKAAWEADKGLDPTINASIAKFYATETALEVVNEALQILGGYGYTKMFPLEKLLRDIRLLRIYEGTSEIQRMIVAAHAMSTYQPVMPPLDDLPIFRDKNPLETDKKGRIISAWRCPICGHIHHGKKPPKECPYCFFPQAAFKKI